MMSTCWRWNRRPRRTWRCCPCSGRLTGSPWATHLDALLQEVSISKNLPAPVHLALKAPDSVVLTVRIHRRVSNEAARYLDMLFVIYANVENRR